MHKGRRFATLLFVALVGSMTVLASAVEPTQDSAVKMLVDGYAIAWNRHDADGLAALFAPDADFINVTGQRWKGRNQIHADMAFLHATAPAGDPLVNLPANTYGALKSVTYRFDGVEVRFVRPDIAIAHATWTQFGDPRFSQPRTGIFSFIAVRDQGRWWLENAQNTLSAASAPTKS